MTWFNERSVKILAIVGTAIAFGLLGAIGSFAFSGLLCSIATVLMPFLWPILGLGLTIVGSLWISVGVLIRLAEAVPKALKRWNLLPPSYREEEIERARLSSPYGFESADEQSLHQGGSLRWSLDPVKPQLSDEEKSWDYEKSLSRDAQDCLDLRSAQARHAGCSNKWILAWEIAYEWSALLSVIAVLGSFYGGVMLSTSTCRAWEALDSLKETKDNIKT